MEFDPEDYSVAKFRYTITGKAASIPGSKIHQLLARTSPYLNLMARF